MCDKSVSKITAFRTSDPFTLFTGIIPKATNCLSYWCIKATGQGGSSWHLHVKSSKNETADGLLMLMMCLVLLQTCFFFQCSGIQTWRFDCV